MDRLEADRVTRLKAALAELRETYAATLRGGPVVRDAPDEPLLVFDRAGSRLAFRAREVLEILPHARRVRVPGPRDVVAGAVCHRQEIFAVLDPAPLLGLPAEEPVGSVVLALRPLTRRTAVLVDAVEGIVEAGALETLEGESAGIVSRELLWSGRPVSVLDAEALARAGEERG